MPVDIRYTGEVTHSDEQLLARVSLPHPGDSHLSLELWRIRKGVIDSDYGTEYVVWIVSHQQSAAGERMSGDYFTVSASPRKADAFLIENYQQMLSAYKRFYDRLGGLLKNSGGMFG